ncbi:MAG: aromatic-ring-hydroxylating dioxygenase subunit beta [Gammaproteobacteria bacterium]|nr:aromatic-ring-hydroxylating dioxygenase subunit beta [Gammaproteobacteria bacterium]
MAGRPPDAANPGRTAAEGLRSRVEDFLFKEAALLDEWRLDEWRLDEWLGLLTEDARYVVPTTDLPDGDPQRDLVFIDDDMTRLRARVARLLGSHALREQPRSRTRRFVSNVRAEEADDGLVLVSANVMVYRFRAGEGAPYVGAIEYRLRRDGDDFKIAYRRAVLDMETLAWHGAVSIIF